MIRTDPAVAQTARIFGGDRLNDPMRDLRDLAGDWEVRARLRHRVRGQAHYELIALWDLHDRIGQAPA